MEKRGEIFKKAGHSHKNTKKLPNGLKLGKTKSIVLEKFLLL